jgi:hypothetical protein
MLYRVETVARRHFSGERIEIGIVLCVGDHAFQLQMEVDHLMGHDAIQRRQGPDLSNGHADLMVVAAPLRRPEMSRISPGGQHPELKVIRLRLTQDLKGA